uniref:LysR family transcriptional regulator n=1 Tax=Undibacterium sp. TaxID=1914977 RepID=UPI00374CBC6C
MDRLDALKVFCRVVEFGGFSRAADKLGMSTSSITNQIAALEKHFGAKLLNRTTRSMSLTEEGQKCYAQALRLLEDMDELESSLIQSGQKPGGSLR